MRPSDVSRALSMLWPTKRPVFLKGPPGVGKSDIFRQTAQALDVQYCDIRLAMHDPGDLKMPIIDPKAKTVTWVNSIFPSSPDWKGIICLEEFAHSPPLMQTCAMQLTLDRRIGDYRLPDGAWVVLTSNRIQDKAGVHSIITPMLNRVIHLDMEVSFEDWGIWAAAHGIAPEVRSYMNFMPTDLFRFEPSEGACAFPTPRSWSFVSEALPHVADDLLLPIVAGCVGEASAVKFVAFNALFGKLPDPKEVLAHPETHNVPSDAAIMWALTGALTEQLRGADSKVMRSFVKYVNRIPTEFGTLAIRDGAIINKKLISSEVPEITPWIKKMRDLGIFGGK